MNIRLVFIQIDMRKIGKPAMAISGGSEGRESISSDKSNVANRGSIVYQVAPEMTTGESHHVTPSQIISFELTKDDINRYVYSRYDIRKHWLLPYVCGNDETIGVMVFRLELLMPDKGTRQMDSAGDETAGSIQVTNTGILFERN